MEAAFLNSAFKKHLYKGEKKKGVMADGECIKKMVWGGERRGEGWVKKLVE